MESKRSEDFEVKLLSLEEIAARKKKAEEGRKKKNEAIIKSMKLKGKNK
jgi:hypothetical protein